MSDLLDEHYTTVIHAIADGELVPFLGAGVNLCGRPAGEAWQPGGQYLPSGAELARYLAREFRYPASDVHDLLRVSQYAAVMRGSGPLYKRLREVFNADYPPTLLHRFLATLPAVLRNKGYPPYQLIVTTNYDDLLECAFRTAGEPFDLVSYIADGEQRGKFLHRSPDGETHLIEKPNEYTGLALDENRNLRRPVILKIHGAVDRITSELDSFVITEDHYIDYLTRADISGLVPATLAAKLKRSNFLFLGYSLRDWNLRVILQRIWGTQRLTYKSWAIQLAPEEIEKKFWGNRDVDIYNVSLDEYVTSLSERLQEQLRAENEP